MPDVETVLSPPREEDRSEAKRSGLARARYNRIMKIVRRAHLYAGLFMTPWVFLYGVTALLFNHPDAFPDATMTSFGPAETAGTSLENAPRPEILAQRVVEALSKPGPSSLKSVAYRLVRPEEARYAREFFASLKGEGQEHLLRLDLAKGEGSVRSQIKSTEKPAPFVRKGGVRLNPPPMETLTKGLPSALEKLGVAKEQTIERTLAPDLSFLMEGEGRTWRVTYNAQTGQVSGRPESARNPLSTRGYLLRLHVAHQYPSELNARWFWAVSVDAMFVSMVGWGMTGLLMWWQMKNVRKVGVIVLIVSALAAAAVAFGMHRVLTA